MRTKLRIPKQLVQLDINMPLNQLCDLRLRILHQQAKSRNIALYDQMLAKEIDHEKEKRDQQTIRHAFKRYLRKGEVCQLKTLISPEKTPELTAHLEFTSTTNSSYDMNYRSIQRTRSPMKVHGVTQDELDCIHQAETDDIEIINDLGIDIRPYNIQEMKVTESSSSND